MPRPIISSFRTALYLALKGDIPICGTSHLASNPASQSTLIDEKPRGTVAGPILPLCTLSARPNRVRRSAQNMVKPRRNSDKCACGAALLLLSASVHAQQLSQASVPILHIDTWPDRV